jgi:hypothetical protein
MRALRQWLWCEFKKYEQTSHPEASRPERRKSCYSKRFWSGVEASSTDKFTKLDRRERCRQPAASAPIIERPYPSVKQIPREKKKYMNRRIPSLNTAIDPERPASGRRRDNIVWLHA